MKYPSKSYWYYRHLTAAGGGLPSLGIDDKPTPYCQRVLTPVRVVETPVGSMVLDGESWRRRMPAHGEGGFSAR